jgi:uncharacterized membrane protein
MEFFNHIDPGFGAHGFGRPDAALKEVRLRYARGEMSREEFAQRSRDLGGNPTEPIDPSQSDVE